MSGYLTALPDTVDQCVCPECGEGFDDPTEGTPVIQVRAIATPHTQSWTAARARDAIVSGETPRWAVLMHPQCAKW